MAKQNANSALIADLVANPTVKHGPDSVGGTVRETVGVLTLTSTQAGGDAGSVWKLVRLPSRARVTSIVIDSDALAASALDIDVGLYNTDGTLVSGSAGTGSDIAIADSFGPFTSAIVGKEAYAPAAADADDYLWDIAGLTADPSSYFDLCLTVVVAGVTPAAGSVSARVKYIDND